MLVEDDWDVQIVDKPPEEMIKSAKKPKSKSANGGNISTAYSTHLDKENTIVKSTTTLEKIKHRSGPYRLPMGQTQLPVSSSKSGNKLAGRTLKHQVKS